MPIKPREYSILPQVERDDFHHHVREGKKATSQYFCLFVSVAFVIFLILAGVVSLTASMFYSEQVKATFEEFWYNTEADTTTVTSATPGDGDSASGSSGGSTNEIASSTPHQNSTDNDASDSNKHKHYHSHHNVVHIGDVSVGNSSGESALSGTSSETLDHSLEGSELDSTMNSNTSVNLDELEERIAEEVREFEKHLEDITGIRKAEFVVPIFMLMSFLAFFCFISVCCCIIMRRRDSRRRKLFGKLITDLQTGDSKTVLLSQSDLDD